MKLGVMATGRCKTLRFFVHRHWLLGTWIVAIVLIFWRSYSDFRYKPQHMYLRRMLGCGLCISKATAAILNLSCCLVLLPVCRCCTSALHSALSHVSRSALDMWLTRVKVIHMTAAYTIVVASVIHTIAHVVNAVNFSRHFDHQHSQLNWADFAGQDPSEMILRSVAGVTGIAMLLLLLAITASSTRRVRRSHYTTFWTTHHLFFVFFALLLAHPLRGVLKQLGNVERHLPGCWNYTASDNKVVCEEQRRQLSGCWNNTGRDSNNGTQSCEEPIFVQIESQVWLWVFLPLAVYSMDICYRVVRRNQWRVRVLRVEHLPGAVRLTILKEGSRIHCKPGQYVLLQCPAISSIEWHPFTVTACPTEKNHHFAILMQVRGDWTESLHTLVLTPTPVSLLVDGPYCSPMQRVLSSRVAVCVAAGVGITSYMAVMQHLLDAAGKHVGPERLHLIWVLRRSQHLQWSSQLITDLHHKIFLTKDQDLLTGEQCILQPRIMLGRPRWPRVFENIADMYAKRKVEVFSCGPKRLNSVIRKQCNYYNNRDSKFKFNHEHFS